VSARHEEVELSVVIPAFDEALRLPPTLERVLAYLSARRICFEIVVVDDGSRDHTDLAAKSLGDPRVRVLRHTENRGKGAALRTGVLASRGRRVLISDADLSTPIEELEILERNLGDAPIAFGSRALAQSRIEVRQPFYRELMGKIFNRILWLLGLRGLWDTQCGFKLLDGELARRLFAELEIEGFAWDVELLWRARQSGFAVVEVPVRWSHEPFSRVALVGGSFAMLRDVIGLRRRLGAPRPSARRGQEVDDRA
jgi:dolichyl-phosphate beta-glucosyltransferase